MKRLAASVEALGLVGLAGFLVYLLVGGDYWMYLNPRFAGLSWVTAAALAGLGVYSLARPPAGASWPRAAFMVLAVGLCLLSLSSVARMLAVSGQEQAEASDSVGEAPLPPRVVKDGVTYVRINLGELYDIVGKFQSAKMGLSYAVRGFVRRTPELDARREFVLYRLALYCCFADTTAVGFRVRLPEGMTLPKDGSWQVIYGRLAPADGPPDAALKSLGGSVFSSIEESRVIEAALTEPAKVPGMGMMYEWRPDEPYAF